MSSNAVLQEINAGHHFSELSNEFGLSTVYIVSMPEHEASQNPYAGLPRKPVVLGNLSGGRVQQLTDKERKDLFGETDSKYVRITIENPSFDLTLKLYALVNYFDSTKRIIGTIASIDRKLNQRIQLYIETVSNVPFTLDQAGVVV